MAVVKTDRDFYTGAARGWAEGAAIVYGPLADVLVSRAPVPLAGRMVVDVGAGTGLGSRALERVGAVPIAVDRSHDMLAWERAERPPGTVADVLRLPFRDDRFGAAFASFVLNHLTDPVAGLEELRRVTFPGGCVLATAYSNSSTSAARDEIDRVAAEHGMRMPAWYTDLKADAIPLLGTADSMAAAARSAHLTEIDVEEIPVDIGVETAEQLVAYRLGQANYASFLGTLRPEEAEELRRVAVEAAAAVMEPYRPVVVFLSALVG